MESSTTILDAEAEQLVEDVLEGLASDGASSLSGSSARAPSRVSPPDDEAAEMLRTALLHAWDGTSSSETDDWMPEDAAWASVEEVVTRATQAAVSFETFTHRGGEALRLHLPLPLRAALERGETSYGSPTCVAVPPAETEGSGAFAGAIGTRLGAVLLLNRRWSVVEVLPARESGPPEVLSLALSAGASTMAIGYSNGSVRLCSLPSGRPLWAYTDATAAATRLVRSLPSSPLHVVGLREDGTVWGYGPGRRAAASARAVLLADGARSTAAEGVEGAVYPGSSGLHPASLVAVGRAEAVELLAVDVVPGGIAVRSVGRQERPTAAASAASAASAGAAAGGVVCLRTLHRGGRPCLLLGAAWGSRLELVEVRAGPRPGSPLALRGWATIRLASPLRAMGPAGGESLLLRDDRGAVLLVDAAAGVMVEEHLPRTEARAPPGTRSAGPARAEEANRLATNHRCGLLLEVPHPSAGAARVWTATVVSWRRRLDDLVRRGAYEAALDAWRTFVEDVALSVEGAAAAPTERRRELLHYARGLFPRYLRAEGARGGSGDAMHEALLRVLELCSGTDAMDLYWGPVFAFVEGTPHRDRALYVLERAMLRRDVRSVPETYLRDFVELFTGADRLAAVEDGHRVAPAGRETDVGPLAGGALRVERALLCLEGNEEVVGRLAEVYGLDRLWIFRRAFHEGAYVEALRLALRRETGRGRINPVGRVRDDDGDSDDDDSEEAEAKWAMGAGPGCSPSASLAVDYVEGVLFETPALLGDRLTAEERASARRALWEGLGAEMSLWWRLLCRDPGRVVRLTLRALERDELSPGGPGQPLSVAAGLFFLVTLRARSRREARARLLATESLSTTATWRRHPLAAAGFKPWELERREWIGYEVVDELITGLVDLLLQDAVWMTEDVRREVLVVATEHGMFLHLTAGAHAPDGGHERRLVQLYQSPCVPVGCVTPLMGALRQARMPRALAAVYCRGGRYTEAMRCYLEGPLSSRDPAEGSFDVFDMLRGECLRLAPPTPGGSRRGRRTRADTGALQSLHAAVVGMAAALARVDANALARLVLDCLPSGHTEVVQALHGSGTAFLAYLDELLAKEEGEWAGGDLPLQNTYLELLGAHAPHRLYPYLRDHAHAITYDVGVALRTVAAHQITDAAVFLLEAMGRTEDAMEVLLRGVHEHLRALWEEVARARVTAAEAEAEAADGGDQAEPIGAVGEERRLHRGPARPSWAAMAPLDHLLEVGRGLYLGGRPGEPSAHARWVRLLDVFARPRAVLLHNAPVLPRVVDVLPDGGTASNVKEVEEVEEVVAWGHAFHGGGSGAPPQPPWRTRVGRAVGNAMWAVYDTYLLSLLVLGVDTVGVPDVLRGLVTGHAGREPGYTRRMALDVMTVLSWKLRQCQLVEACLEAEGAPRHRVLYRACRTAFSPPDDRCGVCRAAVRVRRLAREEGEKGRALSVFACGHVFHERCRDGAVGEAGGGCPCCREEAEGVAGRDGALAGGASVGPCRPSAASSVEIQRRLRHTRACVDRPPGQTEVLKSFLAPLVAGGGRGRDPAAVEPPAGPPRLVEGAEDDVALSLDTSEEASLLNSMTDEQILALFGAEESLWT